MHRKVCIRREGMKVGVCRVGLHIQRDMVQKQRPEKSNNKVQVTTTKEGKGKSKQKHKIINYQHCYINFVDKWWQYAWAYYLLLPPNLNPQLSKSF